MPCAWQQFKGVELGDTITLIVRTARFYGINATGSFFGLSVRLLACRHQRYKGIVPKAQLCFLAQLLVAVNPNLGGWSHTKVQTLAIRKQIFFVERLCRLNLEIVELSHGVPKID